jgi:glucans biosynthesis protein
VEIYEVIDRQPVPIVYSSSAFKFESASPPPPNIDIGFAGFRIHAPINKADYFDEVGAFLGASYFRAVAKGLGYGLSARALAVKTGDAEGEEFPSFKAFWLERPAKGANALVIHALVDSQSASAAYRMTIRPGETTVYDVEMSLFPRVNINHIGIAPLTSMFLFDASDRRGVDDYRSAVHDSDGLAIVASNGETIWRPLCNPQDLQMSLFGDSAPRGFGLMQRERNFRAYQDLESHFESRPTAWIEPIGSWGKGAVQLLEIPVKQEYHDNITAFWRPLEPLTANGEFTYTYRIHWCATPPTPNGLARVARTSCGALGDQDRLFALDFDGDALRRVDLKDVVVKISADKGEIRNQVLQENAGVGGWRLAFQLRPGKERVIELRAQLCNGEEPISETWLYKWTKKTA